MVKNIEKDYVHNQDEVQNLLITKHDEQEIIIDETDEENVEIPRLQTLLNDILPLHNDGYLNTQNKNKSKHRETVEMPIETKVTSSKLIILNGNPIQKLPLSQDIFTFYPIEESEDTPSKTGKKQRPPINTLPWVDYRVGSTGDEKMNDDFDSTFPLTNLLPRLSADLARKPRRLRPVWFGKKYTTLATVQRIYLTHPKYNTHRKTQTHQNTQTGLLNTPLHTRRGRDSHRLCENGCSQWRRRQTRGRKGA